MATSELGEILRLWRERLPPAAAGLPAHGLRRTRGLRREELAVLAGMSADYVVRLEQGRVTAPSAQVCGALARTLRLSDAEQAHLFRLAGHALDGGRVGRLVPAGVRKLLDRLDDHPIAVYDAMWTLVVSNRLWAALMGDPSALDPRERNMLRLHFAGGMSRVVHDAGARAEFERSLVADLRMSAARYPQDPEIAALVEELSRTSERFRALWEARLVAGHEQAAKSVEHPQVGRVDLDCDVLHVRRGDLRLVVYTAAEGSESESKLALLAAIGTQDLAAAAPPGA